jgi:hypothetical protein
VAPVRPRLAYAAYIRTLCRVTESARILVLAQERMAADGGAVVAEIASQLGVPGPAASDERLPHVGRSDAVDDVELDDDIRAELDYYRADLQNLREELRERAMFLW